MNNTCLVCDQEAKNHYRLTEVTSDFVIFTCLIQLLRSPSTFSSCATEEKGKKLKSKEAFTMHTPVETTKSRRGNVEKEKPDT